MRSRTSTSCPVRLALRAVLLSSIAVAPFAVQARVAAAPAAQDRHAQDGRVRFDVPPQALDSALTGIADRGGIQIFFVSDELRGVRSGGVSGAMTVEQALSQALAGTGFGWRYREVGTVVVERLPQVSGDAIRLGAVRVEGGEPAGSVQAGIATEGTGSYTTRAVTIGKAPRSLRETPNSVSVVTREQIEDRNMTSLPEAMNAVTGVTLVPFENGVLDFQSRGFGIESVQFDGVATQGAIGAYTPRAFDIAMYDRVEVLRGPAGLFQGAGQPGGTVNLVRKRALDRFQASGALMAGSWDAYRGEFDVTGPLGGDGALRARAVGAYDDRGSHVDLTYARKRVFYGTLEYDLTDRTLLSVGMSYQGGPSRPAFGLPTYADGRLLDVPRSTFLGARWDRKDDDVDRYFADVEHRLANGSAVTLRVDRTDRRTEILTSAFGESAVDENGDTLFRQFHREVEYEDRGVDGYVTTPIRIVSDRDNLVIGGNYRRYRTATLLAVADERVARNVFDPDHDTPMPVFPAPQPRSNSTERWGVYGQTRLGILPATTLVLGGRLDWWEAEAVRNDVATDEGRITGKFVPYAALLHDLGEAVTLYASYANTFQPQTAVNVAGDFLEPRSGRQLEFGAKAAFLDGVLNGHLALFRIEDANRAIDDPDNPDFSIASGKVRSQGFEAELAGRLLPGWDVTAGYAYTETEFRRGNPGQAGEVFDSGTPSHDLKLWSKYEFAQGPAAGLSIAAGVNLSSGTYTRRGDVTWRQDRYAVVSARIGYRISDRIELDLAANNLFDETYYLRVAPGGRQSYFGEPRNVMLTLRARY